MPRLPTRLLSERLLLRRYDASDAGWYAEMADANRAHLARFESGNALMRIFNEADAREAIAGFEADAEAERSCYLGAFERQGGAFVAQVFVGVANAALPAYVIGYFCAATHLRQGYASEAARTTLDALFATCGALRVGLGCDDTNVASRRVAEKLGMMCEGHLRADKRNADGSVTGSLVFGLLHNEWAGPSAQPPG